MAANLKFNGSIEEFKNKLEPVGLQGSWSQQPNDCWKFTTKDRAGLHWSQTKGTIWFDGPREAQAALAPAVEAALNNGEQLKAKAKDEQLIFVVHGHDHTAEEQLELIIHRLGLEPFVLQDSGGGGRTIIEALEHRIGKNAVSAFGIVLLTPDDVGHAKSEAATEAKPRARQNVILEMGMLLASLTRKRVAILQKGFVERPSDIEGVLYIPFNDHVKEAVPKLAQRLQDAGIALDANAIARAAS